MHLTQPNLYVSCQQAAQNKKGKAAEKSPQQEQPPSSASSAGAIDLNNKIVAQGDKIRNLKSAKAPKASLTCNKDMLWVFFK